MLIKTVSLRFFVRSKVIESELEEPFPDGLSKQPDRCFGGDLFGLAWAGMGWHGLAWAGMGWHGAEMSDFASHNMVFRRARDFEMECRCMFPSVIEKPGLSADVGKT